LNFLSFYPPPTGGVTNKKIEDFSPSPFFNKKKEARLSKNRRFFDGPSLLSCPFLFFEEKKDGKDRSSRASFPPVGGDRREGGPSGARVNKVNN
jgi:hypothetical protein